METNVFLSFLAEPALAEDFHELQVFANTKGEKSTLTYAISHWTNKNYSVKNISVTNTSTNFRAITVWLQL
jgi:hypothetical protein